MSQAETRRVVRAYHDAYRRGDVTVAGALLAESFKFSSPIMAFDSVQQHVAALVRFVPFITGIDMISELYGEEEATLLYDLHTTMPSAAAMQRCAEHFRVSEGRISSIIIIFDATPWRPIIQAAADIRGPLEVAEERGPTGHCSNLWSVPWRGGGVELTVKSRSRFKLLSRRDRVRPVLEASTQSGEPPGHD